MPLKIAVSGKGGVGKTTVAALLAAQYAKAGMDVIAVDADPASSLPAALGVPEDVRAGIVPLSRMLDLIEERTGARPGEGYGGMFSLNPKVDDLVERYAVQGIDGVKIMVLGTIKAPGSGCFCPESSLLEEPMSYLVLETAHRLLTWRRGWSIWAVPPCGRWMFSGGGGTRRRSVETAVMMEMGRSSVSGRSLPFSIK